MFGIEPLARIVRHDARIEVKVPAKGSREAYSYFRQGASGEKKAPKEKKKASIVSVSKASASVKGWGAVSGNKPVQVETKTPLEKEDPNNLEPELTVMIGSGAFGAVYVTAQNTAFKKAGKKKYFSESEVDIAREAGKKGLAPKVLQVVKDGKKNITGYEMELLRGYEPLRSTLSKASNDRASMDKSFDGALTATFKLHGEGIAHGDLHQMNIMQKGADTKIIDFGMSTRVGNRQDLTDTELGRWKMDLRYLQQTYDMRLGKADRESGSEKEGYRTPVQQTFKKTLDIAQKDGRKAYEYYNKEMKNHV